MSIKDNVVQISSGNRRKLQIASEIKSLLYKALLHGKIKSRDLFELNIIITEVIITSDFSSAKIYVYPGLNSTANPNLIEILNSNERKFRNIIAKNMAIKVIPHLNFILDDMFDKATHIEALLRSINK